MVICTSGIEKWAAGIQQRMANDPGRQDLEDHILCNGFLFLDEYLEDILLGARSEPIIELTKTPGRRKDTSKKDRIATVSVKVMDNPVVDLSAIAEGDENEMSRGSLASNRPHGPVIRDKEISYHVPADPKNTNGAMSTVTVSYDPNPDDEDDDDAQAFPSPLDRTFNDSEPTSTASSFPIDPYARDYETHELPLIVPEHAPTKLPYPHSPPAPALIRKASVPVLPSLPGPSPITTGTVTGTRSSWLNKARDVTAKRASVVSGVKRKSGELNGDTDYRTATDVHARATKAAKTHAEGGVTDGFSDKEKGKIIIQPFKAIVSAKPKEQSHDLSQADATAPDGNSEGMMNILKRTVEGLGARVGKSMGKSLGGAAATAAAAEAKAAAKARLAQREVKGSDATRQGRLSISDLVGASESGGAGKGKERESSVLEFKPLQQAPTSPAPEPRASISTTPPDSPPAPIPQTISSHGHITIPKFTVQRAITKELSLELPESQQSLPSTQSTYVSSIFDGQSTWPQSSFGTEYTTSQENPIIRHEEAHGESASSDSAERKLRGSSQENSTASVRPGLVSQASTILSKVVGSSVSSAMGASKRGKPEPLRSIQLAAAAAKKKSKHPGDRHKREREEASEKNAKTTVKKVRTVHLTFLKPFTKKRKVVVEIEKKPLAKKPLSKDKRDLGSSRIGKLALTAYLSQSQLASSSTTKSFKQLGLPASASQPSVKLVGSSQGEPKSAALLKVGVPLNGPEDVRQPSQTLHAQMQARVQVQMLQARQEDPIVPSESIELPDINSEYSNSDDEGRPRTFDPPDWAQSPVLGLALQTQSRLNPDDIFGPVQPLRMGEIFKTRHSRFRARTSSANWAGTDELTTDEQQEYAKRMGYLE
ncbi:hypothetical protein JB92DRAFT_2906603 [Gautieria morchelliformis]|nr:hypothetical protein JB92DRAFT_2906603 [Gautieria morchelliformis]